MPVRKLTDLFVERIKPPTQGRTEYFDATFPGLALRTTKEGRKSWSVFYRFHGRLRRFTIGSYPAIKPAAARKAAQAALERVQLGVDPAAEKRARRHQRSPEAETFGAVARDYLERHHKRHSREATYVEVKRDFEQNALAKWDKRPIASIARGDVISLIDQIVERGAPIQANRTLARLRALFNWAIEKDQMSVSPVARMKLPTPEQTRDRVLSDEEVRCLWLGCDEIGWPFGPLAKLLLLTAQRRDEVADAEWSEIDFTKRLWTIPARRAKNNRAHEVHLSEPALEVLRSLPRIGERFVLTTNGEAPVSGFSRSKRRLDAAMTKARDVRAPDIPHWTLHDLRRTATTGMARLNFPPHVVDRILNHSGGTIHGVAAIYNRFAYLEERRAALEAWGRFIAGLMTSAAANVVPLMRAQ